MNYLSVNWIAKRFGKVPLQTLLIVPFVLQTVGVVALVGYLSYCSGKVAVENLADKLMNQTANRISDRLDTSLETQQQAVALKHRNTQQRSLNITTLSDISTFLSQLQFSPWGQTFILERSGDLLATSTLEIPLIKHDKKPPTRLPATQSQDAQTKAVVAQLQQQYGDLKQIRVSHTFKVAFRGNTLFAQVKPYGDKYGLDWLLVTVIPLSDFMGEIQANINSTILLCGLTLFVTSGMGILTASWITRRIIELSRASQALAEGEWQEPLPENLAIASLRNAARTLAVGIAELRESNHFIQQVTDYSPQILYISNPITWTNVYVNRQSIDILGYTPEEFMQGGSEFFLDISHPDDLPLLSRNMDYWKIAGEGEILTTEYRMRRKDGSWCWLRSREVVFARDENNQVIKILGTAQDISERKQVEAALEKELLRNKTLLNTSSDGIVLLDNNGHVVDSNLSFAKMLGYTLEEVKTLHISDWDAKWSRAEIKKRIEEFNFQKTVLFETSHRRQDGSIYDVEISANSVNWDGEIVQFCICRDITQRKQTEAALKQAHNQITFHIENTPLATIFWNEQFQVQQWSKQAEKIFGWSAEEVLNKNMLDWQFIFEEDLDKVKLEEQRLLSEEGRSICNNRNYRKDGSIIHCQWFNSTLLDEFGNLISILSFAQDVSDRVKSELELQQAKEAAETANQAKSAFLANMSHELRTPLNAILGFAQLMNWDSTLLSEHQEQVKLIYSSGEHLLRLINEVLELSKIEAGMLTLMKQEVDLLELLDSLMSMFSQQVQNKRLQLHQEVLPEVPQYIIVDAQKLQQILINLIGNAIKFTPKGSIYLSVSLANQPTNSSNEFKNLSQLQFKVIDTGIGIAPQDLHIIFDAFTQAPTGQQSLQEGTGLGLTISRRLVQLMGGEIMVNSTLGQGTTFQFTIPVLVVTGTHVQPNKPTQIVTGLAPNQPNYRILVVDDQALNRLLLVKLLDKLKLEVREAANGEEAISLWQQWQPHLVWMDIRMPGLNGYEATKQIRAIEQPDHPTIIIALTAQASTEDAYGGQCHRHLALEAGCNDYISKPFRAETLFSKMAEHLGICYTYANPAPPPLVLKEPLTAEDFAVMPQAWVIELYQASVSCEQTAVEQLIKEIPPEHSSLALSLEQLTKSFAFDKIMQLTAVQELK